MTLKLLSNAEVDAVRRFLRVFVGGGRRGAARLAMDRGPEPLMFRISSWTNRDPGTVVIGGSAQPIRWLYGLVQVVWDPGTDAWVDLPGGLVIEDAQNVTEDANDDTRLGPGYLVANIPDGFEYCPAGKCAGGEETGEVVEAWPVRSERGATITWKFRHPNTLDGACAA